MWAGLLALALAADPLALARQASAEHDYPSFLKHMREAAAAEPNRPRVLLALASAQAKGGAPDEVAPTLERLAAMGLAFDVTREEDFAAVRDTPAFKAVVAHFAQNREAQGRSTPLFSLPKTELVEGVAFDGPRHRYLVANVRGRQVLAVDEKTHAVSEFSKPGDDELGAVFGLAVDAKRQVLWATTSDVPQMTGFEASKPRRAGLVQFDLGTGKQLHVWWAPQPGEHVFGDLALSPSGDVFVSDSVKPLVFRLSAKGAASPATSTLEQWLEGPFRSPQGLAFSGDGQRLYLADYSLGLFVIDVATRAVTAVKPPPDVATVGIDGLYWVNGALLATQNGVEPQRVMKFDLDESAFAQSHVVSISKQRVLLRQDPSKSTADYSLGTLVGSNFVLNAHSGWVDFADDGTKKTASSSAPNSFILLPSVR